MAAHRYWRLHISRSGGAGTVSIGELILATTSGGAQAATGGTASASSTLSTNVASRAFNGTQSAADYWQCATSSYSGTWGAEFVQYDMGAGNSIDVVEMRIYFNGTTSGATTFPSSFVLLHSDDGIRWTVQRAWSNVTFANPETLTFDATELPSNQVFNRVLLVKDVRRNAATNSGVPTKFVALRSPLIGDGARHHTAGTAFFMWSGAFYIAGSTTTLGLPIARRVDLLNQRSGLLERRVFTGPDGQFLFDQINAGPWTVLGVDASAEQNSVVYAHVVPAPMT